MNILKNISKIIVILGLASLVLMPSAIELVHLLEPHDHEHVACSEVPTHLHEKELDCSLCDYKLAVYHFEPLPSFTFHVHSPSYDLPTSLTSSFNNLAHFSYLLRGPPALS